MLLSIDVGIRNLGMCLIDPRTKKIHHWDASGIPPQHSSGLYPSLRDHLKARPWVLDSTKILIEKQPDRNKTMKSVEHFLHSYFVIHDKDVQLYDARFKIPDVTGPGRAMYLKRKKESVIRCTDFIKETNGDWYDWFQKQKKKDDLADTVMQALSYINSNKIEPAPEKKKTPRRPTVNQTETRYSPANLAWLYKNGIPDQKRFDKDLRRYYTNVQEMLNDFNVM
mgnify:CR=1 FL=1